MAKKKTEKTDAAVATKEIEQNESAGGRASFIPEKAPDPEPVQASSGPPPVPKSPESPSLGEISIKLELVGPREVELTLTVDPLRPCSQRRSNFPMKASPEITAAVVSSMLKLAAAEAEQDGINQDHFKRQEDAEAQKRFGAR